MRVLLYVLTVLSAAAVLFVEPALASAIRRGALSVRWLFLPIAIYIVCVSAYAIDRLLLVRRQRYPVGRALFQVAFGLIFALMLLPSTMQDYQAHRAQQPTGLARLAGHADPEVRAAALHALAFRGPSAERIRLVVGGLEDPDPAVAKAAREVLSHWSGRSVDDIAGLRDWAATADRNP